LTGYRFRVLAGAFHSDWKLADDDPQELYVGTYRHRRLVESSLHSCHNGRFERSQLALYGLRQIAVWRIRELCDTKVVVAVENWQLRARVSHEWSYRQGEQH
jgi:hypothetical protein